MAEKSSQKREYIFRSPEEFPYYTLQEGADQLEITPQRMSRILQILEIPVIRVGYIILLDDEAIERVDTAIMREEIKPGRKKMHEEG